MTRRKPNHYIDNKQMFEAMKAYKQSVVEAEECGDPKPTIPRYLGQCMLMIAQRLSHKPNFINYSYREEMISDGVENCICYIDNFDPSKSDNPFAYFTQITYFAFLRRIQKEKKQLYIKHKALENSYVFNELVEMSDNVDENFNPSYITLDNENTAEFVKNFEANLESKKIKRKKGLDKFVSEDEDENSDTE